MIRYSTATRYTFLVTMGVMLSSLCPFIAMVGAEERVSDASPMVVPKAPSSNHGETPHTPTMPANEKDSAVKTADNKPADPKQIDIDRWIENLDSSSFAKREEASDQLTAAGKAAIPSLVRAALKGDLEAATRAIAVLRKGLDASEEKSRDAAREALEKVAQSDSATAARKAKQALNAKEQADAPGQQANPFGGRIIVNGGQLVINGNGVAAKSVSVSNNNGVKETNVSEDGKKIKIVDDPAGGIKIEFKHKRGDKEVTDKYEAKNADEMKKTHPEGYKLYKEYGENAGGAGGFGAVQLQIGGAINPGGPLQIAPVPAVPLQPGAPAPGLQGRLARGARRGQLQAQAPLAPVPLGPVPGPNQAAPGGVPLVTPPVAQPAADQSLEVTQMLMKTLAMDLDVLEKGNACQNANSAAKEDLKKQLKELKQRLDSVEQKLAP